MGTTSIHLPEDLLSALDQAARERGLSRNRIIVEACRKEMQERREWPPGFFEDRHLSPEELRLLQDAADFTETILEARRSRAGSPL